MILRILNKKAGHYNIILSPEQWTGRSMHITGEVHHQRCLDINDVINPNMLHMRSTPIDTGPPSPATLLFNRPMRASYPKYKGNLSALIFMMSTTRFLTHQDK